MKYVYKNITLNGKDNGLTLRALIHEVVLLHISPEICSRTSPFQLLNEHYHDIALSYCSCRLNGFSFKNCVSKQFKDRYSRRRSGHWYICLRALVYMSSYIGIYVFEHWYICLRALVYMSSCIFPKASKKRE